MMSQPNNFSFPNDSPGWQQIRKDMQDNVNQPPHYNRKDIEAITAIEASMSEIEFLGYLKGNVEKYLWRYGYKDKPIEDLRKAEWYLKKLISMCEEMGSENLKNNFNKIDE